MKYIVMLLAVLMALICGVLFFICTVKLYFGSKERKSKRITVLEKKQISKLYNKCSIFGILFAVFSFIYYYIWFTTR